MTKQSQACSRTIEIQQVKRDVPTLQTSYPLILQLDIKSSYLDTKKNHTNIKQTAEIDITCEENIKAS